MNGATKAVQDGPLIVRLKKDSNYKPLFLRDIHVEIGGESIRNYYIKYILILYTYLNICINLRFV